MPPKPVPDVERQERRPPIDRALGYEQAIVAMALVVAVALAWMWLLGDGGGSGGHMAMDAAPDVWSPAYLGAAFVMWALMMVAMMLPSATPMILLFSRVAQQSPSGRGISHAGAMAIAYVAVWTLFSAAAAVAQAALISSGIVSDMALAVGDGRIAGGVMILAGLYQLSPLKRACLDQCRSPLSFIMRLSRPGFAGALRLGAAHGLYCLGCCWALMLLLFVGGVMNIAWIAALALLVLAERHAPASFRIRPVLAVGLMLAGAALVAFPGVWR